MSHSFHVLISNGDAECCRLCYDYILLDLFALLRLVCGMNSEKPIDHDESPCHLKLVDVAVICSLK